MTSALNHEYDVIVVGAGISGLHAASLLQAAGKSCLVLEARNRIGGKIFTSDRDPNASKPVIRAEYGAAWLNDTTQDRVWALAKKFGLTTVVDETKGNLVIQDVDGRVLEYVPGDLPKFPAPIDGMSILALRDLIEESTTGTSFTAAEREELDSISFEAWVTQHLNGNKRALAMAKMMIHAIIGCDSSDCSAFFFLDYVRTCGGLKQLISEEKDGGQHMRVVEGMSSIPEGLARSLKTGSIILNSPVGAIITDHSTGIVHVTIRSSEGLPFRQYRACRVIVSIPTPLYRTINFDPPLSPGKSAYLNSTRYSYYAKYLVTFRRRFWADHGLAGVAHSFVGPVSAMRETSDPTRPNYAFTCFIAGSFGRDWSRLSTADKKHAILKQFADLFAEGNLQEVQAAFVRAQESPWMSEEFNGWGCPIPTLPPGGIASHCWDAFVAPEGNLYFIGNEFGTKWRGYMDAAVRTAEQSVETVVAELGEPAKAKM